MTDHERPVDAGERDRAAALDDLLDRLAARPGDPVTGSGERLDPELRELTHRVHGISAIRPAADPGPAATDRLWRELMAGQPRPELRSIPATGRTRILPPSVGAPESATLPDRPRRCPAGRTPGLVASIALTLLVVLSGLALWQTAPRDDRPTGQVEGQFAAAATPTLPAYAMVVGTPGAVTPAGPMPADAVRPLVQACEVEPRTIEDVITTLARPYAEWGPDYAGSPDAYADRPFLLSATTTADGTANGPIIGPLPAGSPIDAGTMATVVRVYGEWVGCGTSGDSDSLAQAALLSDDGLIREYWRNGLGPDGTMLVGLGIAPELSQEVNSVHARRNGVDPDWGPQVGEPWQIWLWGFRQLGDGRIAAYAARPAGYDDGSYPNSFREPGESDAIEGYVVFVEINGYWLIDENRGPGWG